jgi:hypothetical protein
MRSDDTPAVDPRNKFVYEEALRGINDQARRSEELRNRAATIFSAGAVATSFLGAETFKLGGVPGLWAWTAAAAFVVTGLSSVFVLIPTSWTFTFRVSRLTTELVDKDFSLDRMYSGLAQELDQYQRNNERKLRLRAQAIIVAAIALVVDVLALFIDLSQRL